jgi:DNA-binding beta-propeller fold protein YncE
MGVILLTDQHDHKLLALKPFDEVGLVAVGDPAPLNAPGGIAVDGQGNVIVADTANHCLVIRDLWGGTWQSFGVQGSGKDEFQSPTDIAIDALNRIYVVDSGNQRLVRMDDVSGRGWVAFGEIGKPTPADPAAEGKFADPRCVAIDAQGRVPLHCG